MAPPLQPTPFIDHGHVGQRQIAYDNINGATEAIFEIRVLTGATAPQSGAPPHPPSAQKIEKIFFLIFEFLLFGKCTGMFNSPEKCIYEWEMADFYSFSLSPTIVSHFHDFEQISLALPNFFHCEDYHPRHLFSLLTSHFLSFLGADKHLYKMVCPSVGPSVSIGP